MIFLLLSPLRYKILLFYMYYVINSELLTLGKPAGDYVSRQLRTFLRWQHEVNRSQENERCVQTTDVSSPTLTLLMVPFDISVFRFLDVLFVIIDVMISDFNN